MAPIRYAWRVAAMPGETVYHRWVGWHAPAHRRFLVAAVGAVVAVLASAVVAPWEVAVLVGWDTFALITLLVLRPIILGADGAATEHMAIGDGEERTTARLLVLGACEASLVAVAFVLGLAGRETGGLRLGLITVATLTVVLSWTLVNTVFTLRYAHIYYVSSATPEVEFVAADRDERPDYRDFAYLAFTIGMTYQVSDTTLRGQRIRRTVLVQAVLSYVFGVVIIAAGINLIAGLIT